jgi:hypothetical protein
MIAATPVDATRASVIISEYAGGVRAAEEAKHNEEATIVSQVL